MKKLLLIITALILSSCASRYEQVERKNFIEFVGTDSQFESIELHEVKKFAIQAKNKLRMANRNYIKGQFDCEDYVRNLVNEIKVYHTYEKTPMVYQVNIRQGDSLHAIMGYKDSRGQELFYDPQNYKQVNNPVIVKRIY